MGLFSSSKSSSSNVTNDNRVVNENDGDLSGNLGTINYTGEEAFNFAGDFASEAISALMASSENQQKTFAEAVTGGQTGIVESIGSNVKWIALAAAAAYLISKA